MSRRILVTGGCGFIGSNFLNYCMPIWNSDNLVLNVDCLTYAANPDNVKVSQLKNYFFSKTDICDAPAIDKIFEMFQPDWVANFAAESHVDRSIDSPIKSVHTNVIGTLTLLEACRKYWKSNKDKVFLHLGSDEVFGEALHGETFTEDTPYKPNTPYAASKASANHLARIYHTTYGLPVRITNCSNNYGPNQHIEKFVPKMLDAIKNQKPLTIHKDGSHIRDWLYVFDHCDALLTVLTHGFDGETYNISGNNEMTILDTIHYICEIAAKHLKIDVKMLTDRIEFVKDRKANDRRYSISSAKIESTLGWNNRTPLGVGFQKTIEHYLGEKIKC